MYARDEHVNGVNDMASHDFQTVLEFWFPDSGHELALETHSAFWDERMQGGMDEAIIARFADVTQAAAKGELDHWADSPRGRLALIIALDQFPRSLWRDTPAAFAQDIKATRLALDGMSNGHFDVLKPWEQMFCVIAVTHCEGPDHLERMEWLWAKIDQICTHLPDVLAPAEDLIRDQHNRVLNNIRRFGRHPHRNPILGRPSTHDEEAYIAEGDFPHQRKVAEEVSA